MKFNFRNFKNSSKLWLEHVVCRNNDLNLGFPSYSKSFFELDVGYIVCDQNSRIASGRRLNLKHCLEVVLKVSVAADGPTN